MLADPDSSLRGPSQLETRGASGPYSFTFGTYNQTVPWSDIRRLTWADLSALLTNHEVGPKEGKCIVPAVFEGHRRTKEFARQIDVAFLDSDAGHTLEEITAAICAQGWMAIVSSTHSHRTARTMVRRSHWEKFCASYKGTASAAEAFLTDEKGYLPAVVAGARIIVSARDHFESFEALAAWPKKSTH